MKYSIPEPNPNPTDYEIKPIYGLDPQEAMAMRERMCWELTDAEYYIFLFKPRDKNILKKFIPPPLKLMPRVPMINIFVQQLILNGGKGNASLNYGYLENITAALVSYRGKIGMYPIAIWIGSDIGAMLGREMFGTAKKVGQFEYKKNNNDFSWKVKRRGITLIEAGGQIEEEDIDPENTRKIIENPSFHVQQTIGIPDGNHYAYPPRLMQMQIRIDDIRKLHSCTDVKMVFHESPFDPICLLQPKEISAVSYCNADLAIDFDNIKWLEDLDTEQMLPYLFSKFDPF